MFERRIPEWVRHAPTPGAAGFGVLSALDAVARGILVSVFPLVIYRATGSAENASAAYLVAGLLSFGAGLLIPSMIRLIPRRWMFTLGTLSYVTAGVLIAVAGAGAAPVALAIYMVAAVSVFVCLNAYVLDYVAQADLGRCETLRMFYAALAWTVGPVTGVWLESQWTPLPFLVSAAAGLTLMAVFWWMRLGNGKLIRRARGPATNPLAYLGRFVRQPRLVAGYLFAMIRSCGWWVYVVYLPIFAIEAGLGEGTGGIALSITNSMLFLAPVMLRWVQRRSVRAAVRTAFAAASLLFLSAALVSGWPWLAVAALFGGSVFLIVLDISGGLPFLMAVKPSERTEMSAVYSSYRDVSGIVTPAVASAVLVVAPIQGIFAAGGLGLLAAWAIAGRIHHRLGTRGLAGAG